MSRDFSGDWWLEQEDEGEDENLFVPGQLPMHVQDEAVQEGADITRWRMADERNAVISRSGGHGSYMRTPCRTCPWRVDAVGEFPAEAFRLSAHTAYDAAEEMFGCHETASSPNPVTCAGFLLRNAVNNLGARLAQAHGTIDLDRVDDGGHELHASYREMAISNGVSPEDPVLALCRDDDGRPEARVMRPKKKEER